MAQPHVTPMVRSRRWPLSRVVGVAPFPEFFLPSTCQMRVVALGVPPASLFVMVRTIQSLTCYVEAHDGDMYHLKDVCYCQYTHTPKWTKLNQENISHKLSHYLTTEVATTLFYLYKLGSNQDQFLWYFEVVTQSSVLVPSVFRLVLLLLLISTACGGNCSRSQKNRETKSFLNLLPESKYRKKLTP